MLQDAFQAVNRNFTASAKAAGYKVGPVHHWNFSKCAFPTQVFDARNLVITPNKGIHLMIQRATASDPSAPWAGPINPIDQIGL